MVFFDNPKVSGGERVLPLEHLRYGKLKQKKTGKL